MPGERTAHRSALVAALTAAALAVTAAPGLAATPQPELPDPESPWTKPTKIAAPATPTGVTQPPASKPEAEPSAEVAAWRAAQEARTEAGEGSAGTAARTSAAAEATTEFVPEGQGDVPWHRILDTRLSDALVARVNLSDGNLMLAATDFDIAGVGQKLQLTRTYNSLEAPWGKVSQRWWQGYERYLRVADGEVHVFDATGDVLRFTETSSGGYTTPTGYSKDLRKNADGTYTLTDRKSGTKDAYDEHGTLTKVTDKNHGTITVDQHDEGAEHKGFKLTETRSGRWIDLVKTYGNQWQAKDHTGRTAVLDLDGSGNLAKVTDTAGKATTYDYDASRRLTKVTTPGGTVTVFTYDGHNRVTSLQRATQSSGSGHSGPTWRYDYSAAPKEAGTTTVTDPDGDDTVCTHTADGEVTKVTDPLQHSRHATYANHLTQTATDALGTGADGTGGNVTTYGWDGRNNATSIELPLGATASVTQYQTIAGTDLPNDFTTADGRKDSFTYDTNGNTMSVTTTGSAGGTREYTYNKATPACGGFEGQRCTAQELDIESVRGVVLQLGQVQERGGQQTAVLLPPAACSIAGHRHQCIDQLAVRAGVVSCELPYALFAHARHAGFDLTHLGRIRSEQRCGLTSLESCGLAQFPWLSAQAFLSCGGLLPARHGVLLAPDCWRALLSVTRRTRCGTPGPRKRTTPSCHGGCGNATAREPPRTSTPPAPPPERSPACLRTTASPGSAGSTSPTIRAPSPSAAAPSA
ncbi:hypothetical protein GCM10010145_01380 [Streptomyces ruber]|uniref:DUF6531 domain-containing protein n=2 Tax=Streptomyces TaxID=1883 RepID=A0A918B6X1_9ACTN|nr:hypothetical protein GCM10010145_01380 [Streptomyces ruber]